MMMDYATIMVEDALSAFTPQEHVQALQNWMLFFGDVLQADEVVERLSTAPRNPPRPH
jgi:isochorismate hydrolase